MVACFKVLSQSQTEGTRANHMYTQHRIRYASFIMRIRPKTRMILHAEIGYKGTWLWESPQSEVETWKTSREALWRAAATIHWSYGILSGSFPTYGLCRNGEMVRRASVLCSCPCAEVKGSTVPRKSWISYSIAPASPPRWKNKTVCQPVCCEIRRNTPVRI
jgi:hypothetical protein